MSDEYAHADNRYYNFHSNYELYYDKILNKRTYEQYSTLLGLHRLYSV